MELSLGTWRLATSLDPNPSSQRMREMKAQTLGAQKLVQRQPAALLQGRGGPGQLGQRSRQARPSQTRAGERVVLPEVEKGITSSL